MIRKQSTKRAKPIVNAKSKTKKLTLSSLTGKLDHLTSIYVRARDKCCIVCGSTEYLQNGHYISRTFTHTRWDLENCNAQCARCNRMHEIDPVPYSEAMEARYGAGILKKLSLKARSARKMMYPERVLILEDLKFRVKGLDNG